jgi:hypothetical protein
VIKEMESLDRDSYGRVMVVAPTTIDDDHVDAVSMSSMKAGCQVLVDAV